jgi:hypothetical protein
MIKYDIPEDEVLAMLGLGRDQLQCCFLLPGQHYLRRTTLDGRTIDVKRPWHGDPEMRGRIV